MQSTEQKATRKGRSPIKVYCLPDEHERIADNARKAGMSQARYLREVGQAYPIQGIVDQEQVRELARINGDLGRLGGLLKLWLTDDRRTAQFGESTVRAVLQKIEATAGELGGVMMKIVMPRSGA